MRIDFHPEATSELEESVDWYKEHSRSAEHGFILAVESAILKIKRDPERFPRLDARCQSCNVETYPFQIVFRNDGGRILIIAIAHAKRRPKYWRDRL
ncbi:MAG: type II toxin-antitoxin system RelE/ParE family toxin [Planctomycetaceae bacterium]|nr:type II toxin-antitoxin system RelE/ParE family toxin [Planctomycetaceae bacterium]